MYISGKTGTGKTTLIENLIMQDIEAGNGIAFFDAHGDASKKLLTLIPPWRYNDVVYFDPNDPHPIGLNVLDLPASAILSAFRSIWAEFWGPRMEYIFYHALVACKEANQTLLGALRMLIDDDYRKKVLSHVKDPATLQFWKLEYASYDKKFLTEAIAPIQNKVGRFLAHPIRDIVGQVKSTINIEHIINNRKIFIANLSKGDVGDDASDLVGSMLISMFSSAAMTRASMEENARKDFYLYVDEFQNFSSDSFAVILSEARKYRLCLTLAHQYIDQLTDAIRSAVFGNVGTLITFRTGNPDAEILGRELGVAPTDIQNLPAYNIYLKLLISGHQSRAFSAVTYPVQHLIHDPTNLLTDSRTRYGRPEARGRIAKWLSQ